MARFLAVGVVLCLFSTGQIARAEWKASVNADATAEAMDWQTKSIGPDNQQFRGIYTLKVPATLKNGRAFKLRFLPLVQYDPQNVSTNDPLHTDRNERTYWDVQEGYAQMVQGTWTEQVGFNVQTWGDTDVFNPLDVVNARRYYDPLRSEKIGAGTVLVKREWEKFFIEGLFIPRQPQSLLPGENSRWMPRDIYQSRSFAGQSLCIGTQCTSLSGQINLPNNLRYHYEKAATMNAANNDNFGGRVKFRLPGFDWTIAGFQGAATTPAVNIHSLSTQTITFVPGVPLDINVNPDIYLQPLFFKTRMAGTSFVWSVGQFLIKGASAQNHVVSSLKGATENNGSVENRLPKDDWENVLGFEHTFQIGKGTLTALAQGTYIKRDEAIDSNAVSLARMFDRAAMIGLRWAPSEKWTVLASGLYDIQFKGNFEHAEASYKIRDGWVGKLAADMLAGALGTPLGTYARNDRVILSLNVQK